MEASFNADFSAVRIHEDPEVAAVGARAYARGTDLHFAPGRYQPSDAAGLELLGHELAHVVQQSQGRVRTTAQAKWLAINDDSSLEREADDLGARAARGERVGGGHTTATAASDAPAQGYFETNDFKVDKKFFGPDPFLEQSPEPTLHGGPKLRHEIREVDPVNLRVANDGSMAVHATTNEPKEFYATGQVVQTSNDELAKVESSFRLQRGSGNKVAVAGHELEMVRPVVAPDRNNGAPDADEIKSLLRYICIEMTGEVVGMRGAQRYDAVLSDGVGNDYTRRIAPDANGAHQVDRLGAFLSTNPNQVDRGSVDGSLDGNAPLPTGHPQHYGTHSGNGTLDGTAQHLGVNQGALPEVGEGYAVFSQRSTVPGEEHSDWSTPQGVQPAQRPGSWGYHFAGVVAKSPDGADRIALENYNRAPDMRKLLGPGLVAEFRDQAEEFRAELTQQLGRPPTATELEENLLQWDRTVNQAFVALTGSAGDPREKWFFRMYGSVAGQTFHDEQARSGGFVNPLTLRVRRPLDDWRVDKLQQLDDLPGTWRSAIATAAIADPGASGVLGTLEDDLAGQCATDHDTLTAVTEHGQVAPALAAIEQGIATLVGTALRAAYTAIAGQPPEPVNASPVQLERLLHDRLEVPLIKLPEFLGGPKPMPAQERTGLTALLGLINATPRRVLRG